MAERTNDYSEGDSVSSIGGTVREGDTGEVKAIRADIDDTRESISETLGAIGVRLNPETLKEKMKDGIREATFGRVEDMARTAKDKVNETRYNVTSAIRDNPLPAAMVAIGLGWIFFNGRRREYDIPMRSDRPLGDWTESNRGRSFASDSGARNVDLYDEEYMNDSSDSGTISGMRDASDTEPGAVDRLRGKARDVRDTVSEKAHDLAHKAGEVRESAGDKAHELADRARDTGRRVSSRAKDLADTAARSSRAQAQRVEEGYFSNPLMFGAVAVALGVAAGLAIPGTRREARLMGEKRDQFVDRVKDIAEDKKEKAKHVAERVVESVKTTAREASREEGLMS